MDASFFSTHASRFGSWGVCFTYGTWFALKGLATAGKLCATGLIFYWQAKEMTVDGERVTFHVYASFGIHFLDVCRRNDWPEREEGISGIILGKQDDIDRVDSSDTDDNDVGDKELAKPLEPSHVYLSNAEVQINSERIPIWQKSKLNFGKDATGGEMDIETVPVHEVEMRQKDLLPVVHPFHRLFQSDWNGRDIVNVIACEGLERVERPETYKQWQFRNVRAGFKQLPLDQELLKQARRLSKCYHDDFWIDEDGNWMLQGWKGKILLAISIWVPA
ncbi:hypothetical protein C1H46_013927 [Malus baccata]|uniref:BCAS3 domain-containing protein n=1 Tax=Malus baccata TaxID=106549 RepID=A0A540MNR6_MALBA|nr:hypothetical protein C1H46_013927 [Malus baccata]